jgi:hypothetical protein
MRQRLAGEARERARLVALELQLDAPHAAVGAAGLEQVGGHAADAP